MMRTLILIVFGMLFGISCKQNLTNEQLLGGEWKVFMVEDGMIVDTFCNWKFGNGTWIRCSNSWDFDHKQYKFLDQDTVVFFDGYMKNIDSTFTKSKEPYLRLEESKLAIKFKSNDEALLNEIGWTSEILLVRENYNTTIDTTSIIERAYREHGIK